MGISTELEERFFAHGYAAAERGEIAAPIANGAVHEWLDNVDPPVGDGRFVAVCTAFSRGYKAASDAELARMEVAVGGKGV